MKKVILILLLIVVVLTIAACEYDPCKENSDCKESEECRSGKCRTAACYYDCPEPGSVCKYTACGQGTNFECKIYNKEGSTSGCMGKISGKHCMERSCVEGNCAEVTDTYCLEKEKQAQNKEYCPDGTELGDCSMKNRGYYCNEITHELVLYDDEDGSNVCAEEYDNNQPKKSAIQEHMKPCEDDTLDGQCSIEALGFLCINQTLIEDQKCLPEEVVECVDGTKINECSTKEVGKLCNNGGNLIQDDSCLPEEPDKIGCGDTPEGDCSPEGLWCIHNELIEDEACLKQCQDGTPDYSCSQSKIGYMCLNGELIEDKELCDPNYVYEPIDCEDGTLDGHCTSAQDGYWCNHGVLEYDESCFVDYDECEDGTLSGMCSELAPGEICFYGTLSEDDTCLEVNRCEDFTPNQECSKATSGYFCNQGVLIEDEFC